MEIRDNSGHRHRLRSKFINSGDSSLHDYELIELLLTFGIPRKDVKPIAKELLDKFDTIQGIMDASAEELATVKGVGENVIALIGLIKSLGFKYLEEKAKKFHFLSNTEDAMKFVKIKIAGNTKESLMIIYLGAQNQLINYDCFLNGTINRINVYRREIVELALKNRAVAVIIAHNHPSGFCTPSVDDLQITKNLKHSLKLLDINLLDHIITSSVSSYSMAKHGDLAKL